MKEGKDGIWSCRDYDYPEAACAAMLEAVRRDVLLQTEIKLTPMEEAFLEDLQSI